MMSQLQIGDYLDYRYSLFLGAGFSKWAIGLPLASELFDFKIDPYGNRENKRLQLLQQQKCEWDSNHPHGLAEDFISHCLGQEGTVNRDIRWYIGRRLIDPCIAKTHRLQGSGRHTLAFDETEKNLVPGIAKAQQFFELMGGPGLVGVVTTNYDLVVELALGTHGFAYETPGESLAGSSKPFPTSPRYQNPQLKGPIPYAKLHGSLSWDNEKRYADGRCALTGKAMIVPPTRSKVIPRSLRGIWEMADDILRTSTGIIFFGFSFNPADLEVLQLLYRSNEQCSRVLIIDPRPNVSQANCIWKEAEIESCLPPQTSSWAIKSWLKALE